MLEAGDVVLVDFPGAQGIKRRPAVVLSSARYHAQRPDVILGVVTSQISGVPADSDHILRDWSAAGLRVPSMFRSFVRGDLACGGLSENGQTLGR